MKGLDYICGGYLTTNEIKELSIPRTENSKKWGRRPLLYIHCQYAANNVHYINRLYRGMRNLKLPRTIHERIAIGSEKYTEVFRNADVDYHSDFAKYSEIIMAVVPI